MVQATSIVSDDVASAILQQMLIPCILVPSMVATINPVIAVNVQAWTGTPGFRGASTVQNNSNRSTIDYS